MLKKENSKEKELNVTLEDILLLEEFREVMTETLIRELGKEVQYYLERDQDACILLFLGGALYGEENTNLKQVDIIGRGKEFRSMARYLIKNLHHPSLENFEANEELYTQFMIQGIYFGQKNALLDS